MKSCNECSSLTDIQLKEIETIVGHIAQKNQLALWDYGYHKENLSAAVAVAPNSVNALSTLLQYCHEYRIPVVPHGGLTGLVGGATSKIGSVIISTRHLNTMIEIDPVSRVAIVDAGVTLESLQLASAKHGLSVGIDLPSRSTATLGGMAATNAGGIEAFRDGSMRDRVLGCQFLRADGTAVDDLTRVLKNNTGYSLTDLLVGSEGTLGIITRLAIRLKILKPVSATALFAFDNVEDILLVAQNLQDHYGEQLRAVEILWRNFAETIAKQHKMSLNDMGLDGGDYLLLAEVEENKVGSTSDDFISYLEMQYEQGHIKEVIIAQNQKQRDLFWLMREDADVLMRIWPNICSFDISVPLARFKDYTYRIESELHQLDPKLGIYIFGHLGDGNLHIMIGSKKPLARTELENIIYVGLNKMGGSFSAEHGIGIEKLEAFNRFGNHANRETMAFIKVALDPNNILNPGKLI